MEELAPSTSNDSSTQSDVATILTPTSSASKSLPSPRQSFSRLSPSQPSIQQPPASSSDGRTDERTDDYSNAVRLNGPSSWDAWIASIERLAREEKIWDKIAPRMSIFYHDEESGVFKDDDDDNDNDNDDDDDDIYDDIYDTVRCRTRPRYVTPESVNNDIRLTAGKLNNNQWQQYWNLQKEYAVNMALFEKEQKVLNKVHNHVINTVHERYLCYMAYTIPNYSPLCDNLSALQARVAPSKYIRRRKALHAYRQALNMINTIDFFKDDNNYTEGARKKIRITPSAATKTTEDDNEGDKVGEATTVAAVTSKLEDWHETYQCTLYTCKKLKIPEVEGEEGLRELLQAISTVSPEFAAEYIREIGSRQRDGKSLPRLRIVARKFYERLLVGLIC